MYSIIPSITRAIFYATQVIFSNDVQFQTEIKENVRAAEIANVSEQLSIDYKKIYECLYTEVWRQINSYGANVHQMYINVPIEFVSEKVSVLQDQSFTTYYHQTMLDVANNIKKELGIRSESYTSIGSGVNNYQYALTMYHYPKGLN